MQPILKQKISNHPYFPSVEREIVVRNVAIQGEYEQIIIDACVHYFDTTQERKDVTKAFNSKIDNWIVTNMETTTIRDAQGQPVANPKYKEKPAEGEDNRTEEEKEQYLKTPSFDYFFGIIKSPQAPNLVTLLSMHIVENDKIKFFDKMPNIN